MIVHCKVPQRLAQIYMGLLIAQTACKAWQQEEEHEGHECEDGTCPVCDAKEVVEDLAATLRLIVPTVECATAGSDEWERLTARKVMPVVEQVSQQPAEGLAIELPDLDLDDDPAPVLIPRRRE